ncbi:transketolase family protein [archaeon]|nr:transketolase family protein [archaeon]MBL7057545.1 transketolase family protein [Candidatus Woesearchaeota archaeon]
MTSEQKATRQGYGDALLEIGENEKIVVLSADLSESTKTNLFEEKYPKRFFQCGVAEQNMVGMAAGMALSGKIPFVSTFAAFVPNRVLDQIRVSVCYNDANVKFGSTHAGLTVGEDGATHQAMEDIAVMRALPRMTVIVPCDYEETKKAVAQAAAIKGPVYLRLGRNKVRAMTNKETPFHIGKAETFKNGKDLTIIACGVMVKEAMKAAAELERHNISAEVVNCHTIKPIDKDKILDCAKRTGAIVTAEEHQRYGGLGSAVAEVVVENYPVPMEFIAMNDSFGESGKPEELLKKYHLTSDDIFSAAKQVLNRKKK